MTTDTATAVREYCRRWMFDQGDICNEPAVFIVWGKLFDPEDLGPRCAVHLPDYLDLGRTDQYAVFDLRGLTRETPTKPEPTWLLVGGPLNGCTVTGTPNTESELFAIVPDGDSGRPTFRTVTALDLVADTPPTVAVYAADAPSGEAFYARTLSPREGVTR